MKQTHSYREKTREFFIVFLPIFVTQIALLSTGFFDTVMAGHFSEYDLAGVAVGVNLFFPVFGGVQGIISGLTPTIAQLYGAGRQKDVPAVVIQGIYLALMIGVTLIIAAYFAIGPILSYMALEPKVEAIAIGFLSAMAFGFCPILVAAALRNFIDALGYTRVTMLITICAVPVNICMNYLFIFGAFGFPRLGGIGAGVGSAIAYWMILLLNLAVVCYAKPFSGYKLFSKVAAPSFRMIKQHLAVGVPIGSAMFCEQSIFGAVGLFMAAYGTGIIAAHQAAMNFTTMVYMIPLSISMALTIMVGFEAGARRFDDAKKYSYMGIVFSVLFSGTAALILLQFKPEIAALYSKEIAVQQLIQVFLAYAIFLQFSDAVSAPLQGALRGYKDVRITLILAIVSYWVIGLPMGHFLAWQFAYGPYGYWIGLIFGIMIGAVFLLVRLHQVQKAKFS